MRRRGAALAVQRAALVGIASPALGSSVQPLGTLTLRCHPRRGSSDVQQSRRWQWHWRSFTSLEWHSTFD